MNRRGHRDIQLFVVSLQDINIYEKINIPIWSCESGSARAIISLCILQDRVSRNSS